MSEVLLGGEPCWLISPRSLIMPLHAGNKATLAVQVFMVCTMYLDNGMVIPLVLNGGVNTCVDLNWHLL